jgi:sugar-specific transcriptional regulator TrmB
MLERLAAAGIVAVSRRGSTVEYVGVPPQDLVHKLREKYRKPLEYLEVTLPTIVSSEPEPDILQIASLDAVITNARALLRGAQTEIYVSVWDEDIAVLEEDLAGADERGVRIFAMLYGRGSIDVGSWQRHSYLETVASRIGGRLLTLVADGSDALIAHMPKGGEPSAVRTRNPVLCLVAEEYLRHDLILQKAKTMTGFDEWDRWLHADEDVRALTLGRTGRESPIEPEVTAET